MKQYIKILILAFAFLLFSKHSIGQSFELSGYYVGTNVFLTFKKPSSEFENCIRKIEIDGSEIKSVYNNQSTLEVKIDQEGIMIGQFIKMKVFYESDCFPNTLYKEALSATSDFSLNGYHKIYNSEKFLIYDGEFKNGLLVNGQNHCYLKSKQNSTITYKNGYIITSLKYGSLSDFKEWIGANNLEKISDRMVDINSIKKEIESGKLNQLDEHGEMNGKWVLTKRNRNFVKYKQHGIANDWLLKKKLEFATLREFKYKDTLFDYQIHLQNDSTLFEVDFNKFLVTEKKQKKSRNKYNLSDNPRPTDKDTILGYGIFFHSKNMGTWYGFHENGNIHTIGNLDFGFANGTYQTFYESGEIEEFATWKNNHSEGAYFKFYKTGVISESKTFNSNGKTEGLIKYYHENGYIELIGESVNGIENGYWLRFDENGLISSCRYFEDGLGKTVSPTNFFYPLLDYVKFENASIDKHRKLAATQKNFQLLALKEQQQKSDLLLMEKLNELNKVNLDKQKEEIKLKEIETENQQKNIELLNKDKKIKNQEAQQKEKELAQQKSILYWISGGTGLVLFMLFFAIRGYIQKRKANVIIQHQKEEVEKQKVVTEHQKELVEEKNKEILDSINYAKRIQAAILPPLKLVREYLPQSFILYKPKDIVAGDFYWMENIPDSSNLLFAACDCTGHGVPGAMVSVVCNNGLNRAVREYGLTDPGKILDKTREIVIQEFEKSEEEVKDGMDVSICSLNLQKLKLTWAGANNPLWLIRTSTSSGTYELIEYKPNKQPIGKYSENKPFTSHEIELQKGDSIYIFTDGFADQFGGEKGKKFKTANFKELLLSIQNKNMDEQKTIINNEFEKWRGDLEQNDDVCVIGIRI